LVCNIEGTQFQLPLNQDVILFIEEVEEPLHNIDRMFYRLLLQLDFERVKGVIFGTFNSIRFDLQFGSVEQMLIAHLHNHDIPVCCGFPVGSDSCIPLMVGAPCSLDVTSSETLLSFNIDGEQQLYELSGESHPLFK
jgi:muramoyltetrapeptide carboxypeptidase